MNANKFIKIKRLNQPTILPELLSESPQQLDVKPVQVPEIEQPEQLLPVSHLEQTVEFAREESVYGSGWSLAELMNEFSGR